jgi:hypothetical protein
VRFLLCNPKFPFIASYILSSLQLTAVDDGGTLGVLDGTAAGASSLKSLNNFHGLLVGDLTEDNVASVEPRGDDGGDEELRAVAVTVSISAIINKTTLVVAYVLGPALAMESRPGLLCSKLKFSSANFSP